LALGASLSFSLFLAPMLAEQVGEGGVVDPLEWWPPSRVWSDWADHALR
jgi:hypothetical protein